jgi:hypothetical protein
MRHRIPIQKVRLQWSSIARKLDLVDHRFSSHHGSIVIMDVDIKSGKISDECMFEISKLFNNSWDIRNEEIREFFKTYSKVIPDIKIFEEIKF